MSDKISLGAWLPALLGNDIAAKNAVLAEFKSVDRPPAVVGWHLLAQLFKMKRFDEFDAVAGAVGRAWALTPLDLNEKIVSAAIEGDARWMASLFTHKLTQADRATGFSKSPALSKPWLRLLVNAAKTTPGGWDNLLLAMGQVSSGWNDGFAKDMRPKIENERPPPEVVKVLRDVEGLHVDKRGWVVQVADGGRCEKPFADAWQSSKTPWGYWLHELHCRLRDTPRGASDLLDGAIKRTRELVDMGLDAGAWHNCDPAILDLADIEHSARLVDPALAKKVVEMFDIVAPTACMEVVGSGASLASFWQRNKMDIAQGFANRGAISLAQRSVELGCNADYKDVAGRGWQWHAWSSGVVDIDPCPEDQLHLRSEDGHSLLHCALNVHYKDESFPFSVASREKISAWVAHLLRAGLSLDEQVEEWGSAREMAQRAPEEVFGGLLDAEAQVLHDGLSPVASSGLPKPRRM